MYDYHHFRRLAGDNRRTASIIWMDVPRSYSEGRFGVAGLVSSGIAVANERSDKAEPMGTLIARCWF